MSTTATAKMTTKEIAKKLKKLCDKWDWEGAHRELYGKDAVRNRKPGGFEKESRIDAIIEKGKNGKAWFLKFMIEVSEPMAAEYFCCYRKKTMKDEAFIHELVLCLPC
jgi:hypothetical protein